MNKMGILIADDHKLVREGIINFLKAHGEFEVRGEAADGEEVVFLAGKLKPDVILMDLNMPKMDGIEAVQKIKKSSPDIKIVVLTAFTQNEIVFRAIEAGVDGYLLKDIMPDDLIAAIHTVMNGKPALHPDITRKVMLSVASRRDETTPAEQLTTREIEVLNLLAEGRSNDEIARTLVISLPTVKTHVHNILHKLNMTKRVQVALFATGRSDLFGKD